MDRFRAARCIRTEAVVNKVRLLLAKPKIAISNAGGLSSNGCWRLLGRVMDKILQGELAPKPQVKENIRQKRATPISVGIVTLTNLAAAGS